MGDLPVSIFEAKANPVLRRLRPYTPGPTAGEISRRYGLPPQSIVKLSSNEAPLGPSPRVRDALRDHADGDELHRYPSSTVPELRESIAALLGVAPQQVLPAAGSSQTWPLIVRAFSAGDDAVLWVDPSMTSYGEVAVLGERTEHSIRHDYPFDPPIDAIVEGAREASVVFLSSPNNTTSRLTHPDQISRIARRLPDTIIVVDEHYIEAADDYRSVSAVGLLDTAPNLIVTRSFSKMYGLAGLRIGYAVAPEHAVHILEKFRPNWSISVVAEAAARAALGDHEHLEQNIRVTVEGRAFLEESLRSMEDVEVVPHPEGGFLLFRPLSRPARMVAEGLFEQGVMVRPDLLEGFIRVSVGTKDQNERFLEALSVALTG